MLVYFSVLWGFLCILIQLSTSPWTWAPAWSGCFHLFCSNSGNEKFWHCREFCGMQKSCWMSSTEMREHWTSFVGRCLVHNANKYCKNKACFMERIMLTGLAHYSQYESGFCGNELYQKKTKFQWIMPKKLDWFPKVLLSIWTEKGRLGQFITHKHTRSLFKIPIPYAPLLEIRYLNLKLYN